MVDDRPVDELWVATWAVDEHGRPAHADPYWGRFTGEPGKDSRNVWLEAVHPDDRAIVQSAWTAAFERRLPYRLEYRFRRFDDAYRWVLAVGAPRIDENGVFHGYIGSLVDIEARRATEQALRESEERFRALIVSSAQAIWEAGADGAPIGDDSSGTDRNGQNFTEYKSLGWLKAVHPEDRDETERKWREAVASGAIYEAEFRLKRKKGGWRWSSAHGAPIRAPDGSIRKWVGVNIDINARKLAQEALRESEQRMRLAQDAANAGAWEWRLADNRNVWSENLWALYGLSPGVAATYESWLRSVHPEDRERVVHAISTAAQAGEEFEAQWRINLPAGASPRWVLSRGSPIFGPDGAPDRYIGIVFDISERKNAEDALAESERRYRLLYESMRDPFAQTDMDGRLLHFNELFREMLGYSEDELKRLTYQDLTPERWHEVDAGIVRDQILARGYSDVYEKEYRRRDGTVFPVELRVILSRDEDGNPIGMWAIVRDVTARKQAEAALRDHQQRMRLATQAAEVGIWEWNIETDEIRWDDQLFRIYGMRPPADNMLTFQDWADRVFPDDLPTQTELLRQHSQSKGAHTREFRIVRKDDGEIRVIQTVETIRMEEDGRIEWMVGTNRDITEQKRNEEALREADRRKDAFIATLAHELRNPLAPIHNGVHILKAAARKRGNESDAPVLDMMERQVGHLVRLVDDLLDIARITSGKIELRREPADIGAVLADALETSQSLIQRKGHRVVLRAPSGTLRVHGDPMRLTQAFTNLLNNAAHYTPNGGLIEIEAERRGAEAVVTVRDNGNGVAPDALPRIFELFARIGDKMDDRGLGIGLALVRNLIELHGGAIEAKSAGLGKGSEFVVRLPLTLAEDGKIADADADADAPLARSARKRALIVDDDHDVADTLALLLESLGATVRVAYSGDEGEREAVAFRPEVVFLDLGMPRQDGFETARRIRRIFDSEQLTLVALSGWGQEDDRRKTRAAGFDAHLTKPATVEELMAVLGAQDATRDGAPAI